MDFRYVASSSWVTGLLLCCFCQIHPTFGVSFKFKAPSSVSVKKFFSYVLFSFKHFIFSHAFEKFSFSQNTILRMARTTEIVFNNWGFNKWTLFFFSYLLNNSAHHQQSIYMYNTNKTAKSYARFLWYYDLDTLHLQRNLRPKFIKCFAYGFEMLRSLDFCSKRCDSIVEMTQKSVYFCRTIYTWANKYNTKCISSVW